MLGAGKVGEASPLPDVRRQWANPSSVRPGGRPGSPAKQRLTGPLRPRAPPRRGGVDWTGLALGSALSSPCCPSGCETGAVPGRVWGPHPRGAQPGARQMESARGLEVFRKLDRCLGFDRALSPAASSIPPSQIPSEWGPITSLLFPGACRAPESYWVCVCRLGARRSRL